MTVVGQCKESDYIAAQFLHLRPRPVFAVMGVLIVILAFWALWMSRSLILLGCLAYLALWPCFLWWNAKRLFREYKAMSEPLEMHVGDDGLYFRRKHGEGLIPWIEVIKWRANRRLVLIYPSTNIFHMVPSHFFDSPDAFRVFRETVQKRLGHAT